MTEDNLQSQDKAVADELKGVPEDMLNKNAETADRGAEELARLREELEVAKQDVLYAKAETQNVRRRMEKDVADTRAYAARRRAEGKSIREIRRCLKRAVARQLFKLLERCGSAAVEVAGVR